MDETDFRILGQLLRRPLDTTEDISSAVGLTRNAVARRIRLLENGPLHLRFFAVPHHNLFGAHSTVSLFATDGRVDAKRLLAIDDVIAYDVNHDGLVAATHWTFDDADPKRPSRDLLETLGGTPVAQYTDATPSPKVPHLSRLEWKVLRAVVEGPRSSAAALARRCHLTAKTCARHRRSLIENHYLFPTISVREDQAKGHPVFRVYVQGDPPTAALERILGEDSIVTDKVAEGHVRFAQAKSFGQVLAAIEEIRKLPRVSDVKLILSRDADAAKHKFLTWIDEKLAPHAK